VTSIDLPNRQPSLTPRALFAWVNRWSWLLFWMAAALVAIFQHGPMPMYSTRTLSVAWEMWLRHSYLVPYFNGQPYSDKPPLLLWLIQLGWVVGGVSDIWPRLLEVMLGAVELVLATKLAQRLFPERPLVAQITPWILGALTYGFMFGLQVMYEVLLADCVLAALLCLVPTPRREAPRFAWFALAVSLGLLTKGPVMLLHVAFPWLLGPLWQPWAKREPRQWYGRGAVAIAAGCGVLLTWALLAAWSGGEVYRQKLLVHQTAGRVVDAFAHAEPFWWYVPMLPVLLFPFVLWPRLWLALFALRRPFETGLRFLFVWLGPVLLGFSLVSGKQAYYLLPEYAGFALLMAAARHRQWLARAMADGVGDGTGRRCADQPGFAGETWQGQPSATHGAGSVQPAVRRAVCGARPDAGVATARRTLSCRHGWPYRHRRCQRLVHPDAVAGLRLCACSRVARKSRSQGPAGGQP
jgi:4-amino-4-deoxy-L-arabinose transferase-like glycosyltransferase